MARFFRVRNLEKFQHYKHRNPPWIKLHAEILERYEFSSLPDATKAHLTAIWLLASRTQNRIPWDPTWIAGKINATTPIDLDILLAKEFIEAIHDGNDDLAARTHDASDLLTQRESQSRGKAEAAAEAAPPVENPPARKPHVDPATDVIALFDEVQREVFGQQRRQQPAGDDIVFARRWMEAGADLGILRGVFESKLKGRLAAGRDTILCLKLCDDAVKAVLATASRPPAAAASPGTPGPKLIAAEEKFYFAATERWLAMPATERDKQPRPKPQDFIGKADQPKDNAA